MRRFLPVAQGAVARNLSGNAAIRVFRAAGEAIRRVDALDVLRTIRGILSKGSNVKFLKLDARFDPSRLPHKETVTRRNFGFNVRVNSFDPTTGEVLKEFVTVSTDSVLTRREIEDFAEAAATDTSYGKDLETTGAELQSGFKSASFIG